MQETFPCDLIRLNGACRKIGRFRKLAGINFIPKNFSLGGVAVTEFIEYF